MDIQNPLPRRMSAPTERQCYQARAASKIERAMSSRHISKSELCRALGWPNRNRLDRYLSGDRAIDLYSLSEIAAALDLRTADLIPSEKPRKSA